MANYITIAVDRCKGCEFCALACPHNLISMSEQGVFNIKGVRYAVFSGPQEKCTACSFCGMSCPDLCIEVFKEEKK